MAREQSKKHRTFIAGLPCLICRNNIETEAAHVRHVDRRFEKPLTGMGIKPDDCWVVPLCGRHHREQHAGSERAFWERHAIDPLAIARELWSASGDQERGEEIVFMARSFA